MAIRLVRGLAVFAGAVSLALGLALGGLYAWLQYDLDNIKVSIQWVASAALERDLHIGEVTAARLGTHTRLAAREVTMANPDWATESYFASAKVVVVEIDVPSLWREGPVLIEQLELTGATLNLQHTAAQGGNWDFWPDREPSPETRDGPLPVLISRGAVEDSTVRFVDDDQDVTAALQTLDLSTDASSMLTLASSGNVNTIPFTASGSAGPSRALFTGRDLNLDLALDWGAMQGQVSGSAGNISTLEDLAINWSLQSPSSRPLMELLGAPEVRDGPINLRGNIATTQAGLQVDTEGQLESFAIAVQGGLGKPQQLDEVNLRFDLSGPSLHEAGAIVALDRLPDVPFELSGRVSRQGTRFAFDRVKARVADSQLTTSGLLPSFPDIDDWQARIEGQDIDLALLGPALGRGQLPVRRFSLQGDFSSNDAGVELVDVTLQSGDSQLHLDGIVGDAPNYAGTRLDLLLKGSDISRNAPWLGLKGMPATPFEMTVRLGLDATHWLLHQGRLTSADLSLGLEGRIERDSTNPGIDARLQASTPDLRALLAAYHIPAEHAPGLASSFSGHLGGSMEKLNLLDGKLDLGQAEGAVTGELGQASGIKLRIEAQAPDIRELIQWSLPGASAVAATMAGELHADSSAIQLRDLRGHLGNEAATLDANASISLTGAGPTYQADLNIAGEHSSRLAALLDTESPLADGAFSLNTVIAGSAGVYRAEPFSVIHGENDLDGSIELRQLAVPEIHATLRSKQLHLPSFLPDIEELAAQEQARKADGADEEPEDFSDALTEAELKERTLRDTPLPLQWLRDVNGSLAYLAETIYIEEGVSSQGSVMLQLADGRLSVAPLTWGGTYTAGRAHFSLDAATERYAFELNVDGERFPLLWLVAGEPDYTKDSMFKAHLTGQGNTAREMAASLNGGVIFKGEGGRMNTRGLDLIIGDLLTEILDTLNPTTQSKPYTRIKCNAGALSIKDGVIEAIPGLILRSSKSDILAAGLINLKNERLDMAFRTRPRKGLGISAGRALSQYVKLGGTLANPRLSLDATAAAVSGGAAVATAGWSILASGFWDRWIATAGDPCARLIQQAQKDSERDYEALLNLRIPDANPVHAGDRPRQGD